jgi:hypothetical protein
VRALPLLSLVLLASGCPAPDGIGDGGPGADAGPGRYVPPTRELCNRTFTAFPTVAGNLGDDALVETSGIAAGLANEDILWMHNDSGDSFRVFAIGTDGAARGRLNIAVQADDVEDIAAAACPDGSGPCVWVADTGDNAREREEVALIIVPEPAVPAGGLGEADAPTWTRVPFTYEGGPVDVEAVVVAPAGDRAFLIEKRDEATARVFVLEGPFLHAQALVATELTVFDSPGVGSVELGRMITGADLHPSGRQLALRTYTTVHVYRFEDDQGVEALGAVTPLLVTLGPLTEPQGEAIAFDATGYGLWTASEDRNGMPGQPLHHYDCE